MDADEEPDDVPAWVPPGRADGAWGRTANPNTADGELQNIAAFGSGLARLTGGRRRAVQIIVWAILIGFVLATVVAVIVQL